MAERGKISLFGLLDGRNPDRVYSRGPTVAGLLTEEEMKAAQRTLQAAKDEGITDADTIGVVIGMVVGALRQEAKAMAVQRDSRVGERYEVGDIEGVAREIVEDVLDEQGREVIIEQTRGNIRWKLVSIYVVSVATGEVTIREGIPVPKSGDKDTAIRWYVPALKKEITNQYEDAGYVAFVNMHETIDYLEGWANRQRKRITAAYTWMAKQSKDGIGRENRLGS